MVRREYSTPRGTHDLLYNRCALIRRVEKSLIECYALRGYKEVMTPLLEYYDVFAYAENTLDHGDIYKLVDGGNILVIRPDSTTPIGRLVATKLSDSPLPIRLYYSQDVVRFGNGHSGSKQIRQSGVELIGADGAKADIEIAETAIRALEAAGLDNFKLELGHAGIFKALTARIDFSADDLEQVRKLIEVKNYPALNDVLGTYAEKYPSECEAISRLPRLFGGREVFDEAAALVKENFAAEQIEYLKHIYNLLDGLGFGEKIVLDLGLVHHMDYYTGVIIGGYASGSGERVLSGGRYGALYEKYGMNISATGFAVNVDAVCDALEKTFGVEKSPPPDVMIFYAPGNEVKAYQIAEEYRRSGICAEMSVAETLEEAVGRAKEKGIKKLVCCDGSGWKEISLMTNKITEEGNGAS